MRSWSTTKVKCGERSIDPFSPCSLYIPLNMHHPVSLVSRLTFASSQRQAMVPTSALTRALIGVCSCAFSILLHNSTIPLSLSQLLIGHKPKAKQSSSHYPRAPVCGEGTYTMAALVGIGTFSPFSHKHIFLLASSHCKTCQRTISIYIPPYVVVERASLGTPRRAARERSVAEYTKPRYRSPPPCRASHVLPIPLSLALQQAGLHPASSS
jgi:hypothetical protein